MGKGQDAKKNVKKVATKTAKEKKAEKRLKKAKQNNLTKDISIQQLDKITDYMANMIGISRYGKSNLY